MAEPTPSPNAISFAPPPPGLNYIAAIQPFLSLLLIHAVFGAILIPIICVLFTLSTANLRKTPIFLANVLSILAGMLLAWLGSVDQVQAILDPLTPQSSHLLGSYGFLNIALPVFVDFIPTFRVVAVYPYRSMSYRSVALVYIPIVILKLVRLANAIINLKNWFTGISAGGQGVVLGQLVWNAPFIKVGLVLLVLDTGLSSALFLWRIYQGRHSPGRVATRNSRTSYAARLRSLFWLTVTNFVIPVIIALTILILNLKNSDYFLGIELVCVNIFTQIICGLLATVWSGTHNWTQNQSNPNSGSSNSGTIISMPVFAAAPGMSASIQTDGSELRIKGGEIPI